MRNTIIVLMLMFASFSGVFASNKSIKTVVNKNLGVVSKSSETIKKQSSNNLVCGYSGHVTDGKGEVVGHWYSSCTGYFIYIVMCQ